MSHKYIEFGLLNKLKPLMASNDEDIISDCLCVVSNIMVETKNSDGIISSELINSITIIAENYENDIENSVEALAVVGYVLGFGNVSSIQTMHDARIICLFIESLHGIIRYAVIDKETWNDIMEGFENIMQLYDSDSEITVSIQNQLNKCDATKVHSENKENMFELLDLFNN